MTFFFSYQTYLGARKTLSCVLVLFILSGCSQKDKNTHPVDLVIESMSDSLPSISLPEDVDSEDENWKGIDLTAKQPVLPLYPEGERELFVLQEGYTMTTVLTEPEIEQPGAIAFDGNGRMFVLELRTYMLTADSDGTLEPTSRISRWEDVDNDGVYEKGTVFVDSLIFPRFVLPYGKDCILTMESDADEVYKYTDTDGDGKADKKEFFTNKYGRSGNVEHQQAFMYWGMDNWLYSTVNAFRVKETPNGVIREKTGYNRAQWGVTHDDDGKLWFQGGASGLPSYFQFPIHYGTFEVKNQFAEGFDVPWGAAVKIEDMQGGMDEIRRPDGSLNRVTGAAGNDVFRGDKLPKEAYGKYFYGEPVARIVRQVNPVVTDGLTTLHNVHQEQKSEFIKSTDPLFRPVDMTTAPDGTLYVTDMYHGIIQEGQWTQKGTYLRTKIEQYQLDKVIGLGRIWRVGHNDYGRDKVQPRMLEESPSELVKHLSHPNGWWRDKAQQLIVLAKDRSIVPQLERIVEQKENLLARFHALWCLEGLGALEVNLVKELLQDSNPRMQVQALRVSESLYKTGQKVFDNDFRRLMSNGNTDVAIQAMLTANILEVPTVKEDIKTVVETNKLEGIQIVGNQILNPPVVRSFMASSGPKLTDSQKESLEKGAVIFNELCVQCHGNDGTGTPMGEGLIMAPPLTGSVRVQSHPEYVIKTLLHGLSGSLDGKSYPGGIMVGMKEQSDDWMAAVLSYIRLNLTNEASLVTSDQVAKIRAATKEQNKPYSYDELLASVPQILKPSADWVISASHNAPNRIGGTASTLSAFNLEGWTTGEKQQKGQWFQLEFPQAKILSEVHFVSPGQWRGRDNPRLSTYPQSFEVQTSLEGDSWNTLWGGKGTSENIDISFDPVKAKFLRIVLTDDVDREDKVVWTMKEMKLYGLVR